jgi:hypothetical protein
MRLVFILFVSIILACANAAAADKTAVPGDFAYGMQIQVDGGGALYEISLPLEFYRGVTRSDLADAGVFNGQDEAVPYTLRHLVAETAAPPAPVSLPIFPVLADPAKSADSLSLQIRRDANGNLVSLNTTGMTTEDRKIAAYLLDASSLGVPMDAIELHWREAPEGFVGKITVDYSNDLEHWNPLASNATVASLKYSDHILLQRKIRFPATKARYLRISWPEKQAELKLTGVTANPVEKGTEQPREWVSLDAALKRERPAGEYYFDSRGFLPVDRIKVDLPQKNTLVSASIFSRPDEKSEWRPEGTALVYNLQVEESEIVSPPIIPASSMEHDRYWMLRIESAGGGLGHGLPKLELGWRPRKLLFVARGGGPFRLAYGSARFEFSTPQVDKMLLQLAKEHNGRTLIKPAAVGPRMILGGESMLQPPPTPLPWMRWALWLVLVLGVVFIAWMSLRLYKQMQGGDPGGG